MSIESITFSAPPPTEKPENLSDRLVQTLLAPTRFLGTRLLELLSTPDECTGAARLCLNESLSCACCPKNIATVAKTSGTEILRVLQGKARPQKH